MKLKDLLKEVTVGGDTGGQHYGRGGTRGKEVDDIFAGGFTATDNIKGDLTKQFNDRKNQRKKLNIDDETELPMGGFYDIETPELLSTYDYLNNLNVDLLNYNEKNTPELDTNFYVVDSDSWKKQIKKRMKQNKEARELQTKFINTTEDKMQIVDLGMYELDVIEDKTEENKKFINDTNDWKSIYDSKKY